jgi:hypothetical protein
MPNYTCDYNRSSLLLKQNVPERVGPFPGRYQNVFVSIFRVIILLFMLFHGFCARAIGSLPRILSANDPQYHVYQYSVEIGSRTAYLWIPPKIPKIKGVIVSMANLLERKWLEDPLIRKVAEDNGLGIMWIGPAVKGDQTITADMKPEMVPAFQHMMDSFAAISGYGELSEAPILPMGHSANGHFAWTFANALPKRTIAAIPIKTVPFPGQLNFTGIPICYVVGQTTEWPQFRLPDPATKPGDRDFYWPVVRNSAMALREKNADNLVSVVTDPGGGHFDWSKHLAEFIAIYINAACKYRLPVNGTVLRTIVKGNGWLTGTGGMQPDGFPPAPYSAYKGEIADSYWFFDRETALAAAAFEGDRVERKKQMVTFVEDGGPLPVAKTGFANLSLKPDSDGLSFHVKGAFISEIPPELIGSGLPLGHTSGEIKFSVITGPAAQLGPDFFKVQFDRGNNTEIWLQEEITGDKDYRYAVQPGKITLPAKLIKGSEQKITFEKIDDITSKTKSILLKAHSNSGLQVNFYIKSGPAYIEGNMLRLTAIPLRARLPVKVIIVAYQFGRVGEPAYQSAEPIEQILNVIK